MRYRLRRVGLVASFKLLDQRQDFLLRLRRQMENLLLNCFHDTHNFWIVLFFPACDNRQLFVRQTVALIDQRVNLRYLSLPIGLGNSGKAEAICLKSSWPPIMAFVTMKNATEIWELEERRLAEANVLLQNDFCEGALYLAGYSIELFLKAKICELLRIPGMKTAAIKLALLEFRWSCPYVVASQPPEMV